jgi:hypothetical protein
MTVNGAEPDAHGDVAIDLSGIEKNAAALETEILRAKEAETVLAGALANKADKNELPDLSPYAKREDVESALAEKQGVLEAGENITIVGNVISATGGGGDLTAVGLEVNETGQLCVTFETEE